MSTHKRHAMHINSLEAYHAGRTDLFSARETGILATLREHPESTDRELMRLLGFTDMNAVRPRITELLHDGVIEECGDVIDPLTHKRVRLLRVKPDVNAGQAVMAFAEAV